MTPSPSVDAAIFLSAGMLWFEALSWNWIC
jgi:hypothetical protein